MTDPAVLEAVENAVRDEAYDGSYGPLSEGTFNAMCHRIAVAALEAIATRQDFRAELMDDIQREGEQP